MNRVQPHQNPQEIMMKKIKIFNGTKKEQVQMIGLAIITLIDCAVILCTLGFVVTELRAWYLFDLLDD